MKGWDRIKRLPSSAKRRRVSYPGRGYSRTPTERERRAKIRAKFATSAVDRWFLMGGPSCSDHPFDARCVRSVRYGDRWYGKGAAMIHERGSYATEKAAKSAGRGIVRGRVAALEKSLVLAKRNLARLTRP